MDLTLFREPPPLQVPGLSVMILVFAGLDDSSISMQGIVDMVGRLGMVQLVAFALASVAASRAVLAVPGVGASAVDNIS